ncbi:hypothetical protein DIPPA_14411 [Diplonema papillatum]|nr:hypothetical protein DIPPA_14411 [Diplonema papillatum]
MTAVSNVHHNHHDEFFDSVDAQDVDSDGRARDGTSMSFTSMVVALNDKAVNLCEKGQLEAAGDMLDRASSMVSWISDQDERVKLESTTLNNVGYLAKLSGDLQKAAANVEAALELECSHGDPLPSTTLNLAAILNAKGMHSRARDLARLTIDLLSDHEKRSVAYPPLVWIAAWHNLAVAQVNSSTKAVPSEVIWSHFDTACSLAVQHLGKGHKVTKEVSSSYRHALRCWNNKKLKKSATRRAEEYRAEAEHVATAYPAKPHNNRTTGTTSGSLFASATGIGASKHGVANGKMGGAREPPLGPIPPLGRNPSQTLQPRSQQARAPPSHARTHPRGGAGKPAPTSPQHFHYHFHQHGGEAFLTPPTEAAAPPPDAGAISSLNLGPPHPPNPPGREVHPTTDPDGVDDLSAEDLAVLSDLYGPSAGGALRGGWGQSVVVGGGLSIGDGGLHGRSGAAEDKVRDAMLAAGAAPGDSARKEVAFEAPRPGCAAAQPASLSWTLQGEPHYKQFPVDAFGAPPPAPPKPPPQPRTANPDAGKQAAGARKKHGMFPASAELRKKRKKSAPADPGAARAPPDTRETVEDLERALQVKENELLELRRRLKLKAPAAMQALPRSLPPIPRDRAGSLPSTGGRPRDGKQTAPPRKIEQQPAPTEPAEKPQPPPPPRRASAHSARKEPEKVKEKPRTSPSKPGQPPEAPPPHPNPVPCSKPVPAAHTNACSEPAPPASQRPASGGRRRRGSAPSAAEAPGGGSDEKKAGQGGSGRPRVGAGLGALGALRAENQAAARPGLLVLMTAAGEAAAETNPPDATTAPVGLRMLRAVSRNGSGLEALFACGAVSDADADAPAAVVVEAPSPKCAARGRPPSLKPAAVGPERLHGIEVLTRCIEQKATRLYPFVRILCLTPVFPAQPPGDAVGPMLHPLLPPQDGYKDYTVNTPQAFKQDGAGFAEATPSETSAGGVAGPSTKQFEYGSRLRHGKLLQPAENLELLCQSCDASTLPMVRFLHTAALRAAAEATPDGSEDAADDEPTAMSFWDMKTLLSHLGSLTEYRGLQALASIVE